MKLFKKLFYIVFFCSLCTEILYIEFAYPQKYIERLSPEDVDFVKEQVVETPIVINNSNFTRGIIKQTIDPETKEITESKQVVSDKQIDQLSTAMSKPRETIQTADVMSMSDFIRTLPKPAPEEGLLDKILDAIKEIF